ncbi:MAG: sel1 repeat family protein [Myxococcales bacterium]|nr:MAG: sel1 repeat family protein [Myxococcales bacterium]
MRHEHSTLAWLVCLVLVAGSARADRLEDAEAAVRERRYADAAAIWTELAASGNGEAQYRLGSLYRAGRGVARDDEKAVEWLRRAAAVGHAEAQYGLASMIERGWGAARDRAEATEWYRKAAARGHLLAARRLRELNGSAPAALAPDGTDTSTLRRAVASEDAGAVRAALAAGADANAPVGART